MENVNLPLIFCRTSNNKPPKWAAPSTLLFGILYLVCSSFPQRSELIIIYFTVIKELYQIENQKDIYFVRAIFKWGQCIYSWKIFLILIKPAFYMKCYLNVMGVFMLGWFEVVHNCFHLLYETVCGKVNFTTHLPQGTYYLS